ncbi:MAG: O-antigen ligase family protein [Lentisphaeria bacterium]|nr:O-antigen ligase family protein [Lentisphaeria bacterium]NQZ70128.1 O-antigen ligase family protein [Lentisphaeria bacterium]
MQKNKRLSQVIVYALLGFSVLSILAYFPAALLGADLPWDTQEYRLGGLLFFTVLALLCTFVKANFKDSRRYAISFFLFIPGLCIYFMPIASHGNAYLWQLPVNILLSALALSYILFNKLRYSKLNGVCILVFLVMLVFHLISDSSNAYYTLYYLSYILIPLGTCILLQKEKLSAIHFSFLFSLVWIVTTLYAVLQIIQNQWPTGISLNPNWLALIILITCPWMVYLSGRLIKSRFKEEKHAYYLSSLIILTVSVFILYHCNCKAAWLAVMLYVLFFVLNKIKSLSMRILYIFCIILCFAGSLFVLSERIIDYEKKDVRIPLFSATARLVLANPLNGCGPGNFFSSIQPELAGSDYFDRAVAGESAEHSHNELLQIAAVAGLPAMLAFALLLIPLFRNNNLNPMVVQLAQFSALTGFLMGMFDKGINNGVGNILWLIALGICWMSSFPLKPDRVKIFEKKEAILFPLALVLFISLALFIALPITQSQYLYRRARQAKIRNLNNKAYDFCTASLQHNPANIKAAFLNASLSLKLQHKNAWQTIQRALAINPNYPGLNQIAGRYHMLDDNPDEASRYFRREISLQTNSIVSLQWYYISVLAARRMELLQDARTAIYDKTSERIRKRLIFENKTGMIEALKTAYRKSDWKEFQEIANFLLSKIHANTVIDLILIHNRQFSVDNYDFRISDKQLEFWPVFKKKSRIAARIKTSDDPLNIFFELQRSTKELTARHLASIAMIRGHAYLSKEQNVLIVAGKQLIEVNTATKTAVFIRPELRQETLQNYGNSVIYAENEYFLEQHQIIAKLIDIKMPAVTLAILKTENEFLANKQILNWQYYKK